LLPYAQYWSWWLSGVAASEVSSLGCHTHLWHPCEGRPSALARRRGWAERLAPMRAAWDVLGCVRPSLAGRLGLPPGLQVHTGVHDSNACLARYLRDEPRLTLVTTGTWCVVMAPGSIGEGLRPELDLLANVSVQQQRVPTGRFMGGRELAALCDGADPALADATVLQGLIDRGILALPGFEPQGGPFRDHRGEVVDAEGRAVAPADLTPAERASLAALYTAQVTAWLIDRLGGLGPVVVDGPFAGNPVYTGVLAALCRAGEVRVTADAVEGTARGAWMLMHWQDRAQAAGTEPVTALALRGLQALHVRWCGRLAQAADRGGGVLAQA